MAFGGFCVDSLLGRGEPVTVSDVTQVLAVLAALAAAIASWRTAVATREAAVGHLVNDLIKEYKTVGLRDALRRLRQRASAPEQWVEEWWKALAREDPEAKQDEEARYMINGYFNRIADLMRAGLLTENAVRVLVQQRGIAIWCRAVEPMTKKHNPNIADSPFEALREQWRRYGYKRPLPVPGGRAAE